MNIYMYTNYTKIFNLTDIQVLYIFLDKIWKLLTYKPS